ncbi:MAG: RNA polymerase sporulation sigma factor SigK [Eubacteriales bacterium]
MILEIFSFLKGLTFLAGYFSEGKSFPMPLSLEDEKKYLCLMCRGDEDARNILIEHNLRLVAHIAKKYDNLNIDNDDLISIGTIGLIKAVNTFDPNKKIRLVSYASRCIENEILMSVRALKRKNSEISLNDQIGVDKEGVEIALIDIISTKDENVIDEVNLKLEIEKLYALINKTLTSRERTVIELRYGIHYKKGYTQREIAQKLGISRSYVSRIESRALKKLAFEFKDNKQGWD